MLVPVSVLVFVSVLGQRGAGSGQRGAASAKREPLHEIRPHAKRQPDTNTSTDTGSLTAPISARVEEGGVLWRHRTGA